MLRNLLAALVMTAFLQGCVVAPKVDPVDMEPAGTDGGIAVLSPAQYNLFALTQFDSDVPRGWRRRFRFYQNTSRPERKEGTVWEIYKRLGDQFFIEQARNTLQAQGYNVVTPDQASYFLVYSDVGFSKTPRYGNAGSFVGMIFAVYSLGLLPPFCDDFAFTVQHSVYAVEDLGTPLETEQNVHVTRGCLVPWGHAMFPKWSEGTLKAVYGNLVEKSVKSMQVNYVLY